MDRTGMDFATVAKMAERDMAKADVDQRLADIERAVVLLAAKIAGPFGVSLVDRHDGELMRIVQRMAR